MKRFGGRDHSCACNCPWSIMWSDGRHYCILERWPQWRYLHADSGRSPYRREQRHGVQTAKVIVRPQTSPSTVVRKNSPLPCWWSQALRQLEWPSLYVRKSASGILIISLYVDDLLTIGNCRSEIAILKGELSRQLEMKDLEPAKAMLVIEITRDRGNRKLFITQEKYTLEVLKRFRIEEARTVSTPMDKSTFGQLDADGKPCSPGTPYRHAIGWLIYLVSHASWSCVHSATVVSIFRDTSRTALKCC